MDEQRLCTACGAEMAGPFRPRITLTQAPIAEEPEQEAVQVSARSWVCPGCGLVHWYAEEADLDRILDLALADEEGSLQPGQGYERRAQVLRMLQRVRRM